MLGQPRQRRNRKHHFWSDLTHMEIEYCRRSSFQASLAIDLIYNFYLRYGLNLSPNRRHRKATSLRVQLFIMSGENSVAAL